MSNSCPSPPLTNSMSKNLTKRKIFPGKVTEVCSYLALAVFYHRKEKPAYNKYNNKAANSHLWFKEKLHHTFTALRGVLSERLEVLASGLSGL